VTVRPPAHLSKLFHERLGFGTAGVTVGISATTACTKPSKGYRMTTSEEHRPHEHADHVHGEGCGHEAVQHGDHVDYLHDEHRHAEHEGHYDEHGDA